MIEMYDPSPYNVPHLPPNCVRVKFPRENTNISDYINFYKIHAQISSRMTVWVLKLNFKCKRDTNIHAILLNKK